MIEDSLIPVEIIERKILNIRSTKVLLDQDLALLYGVETKYLTRQVRRNIERFPKDFCFVLTRKEFTDLKRQFGTSRVGEGEDFLPLHSPNRVLQCYLGFWEVKRLYRLTF